MRKCFLLLVLLSMTYTSLLWAHPEGDITVGPIFDWRQEDLPYVVSDRTREEKVDTQFLKAALNDRLKEIYSQQFLFLPLTVKSFMNEGVFSILGSAALASNAVPSPLTLAGEALSVIQIIFNQAMWGEVTDSLTITNLMTMGINILISDPTNYDVIYPLAEVYDQVGMNVRGMHRIRLVGIPFSLFNYIQPWFEVPDLNFLPVWATAPQLTSLPVDWILSEAAFDLATFTLRFAAKNPDLREEAFEMFHEITRRIKDATKPGNDIDSEDLSGLISVKGSGNNKTITLDETEEKISEVDKLEVLVDLKKRIRKYFVEDPAKKLFRTPTEHGHLRGTYREIVGGYLSCMVSDAVYTSLMSEMLKLEAKGHIYQGGRAKILSNANLSHLEEDEKILYKKLYPILRNGEYLYTHSTRDNFALTQGERSYLKNLSANPAHQPSDSFNMKNCIWRYPNRYFDLTTKSLSEVESLMTAPLKNYLVSLEDRVKDAQRNVQVYGRELLNDNITAYKLKQ